MAARLTRRELITKLRGGGTQLRPPWSTGDGVFTEHCTSCGACIRACPTGLLVAGRGGYPIADFANAMCTFCGRCADACGEASCFNESRALPAWRVRAVISPACVETKGIACRMCEDACPHSAISFVPSGGGRSVARVASESCTGCGCCLSACPVSAIAATELIEEAAA